MFSFVAFSAGLRILCLFRIFLGASMAIRAFWKSRIPFLTSTMLKNIVIPLKESSSLVESHNPIYQATQNGSFFRLYHDGRPRGPLWKGKKMIGKEALFVILGLKRFINDEEKLNKFIKSHVLRLLKMDLIAVLTELERQEENLLALKIFEIIQNQDWYKPDVYLYKDLIIALSKSKKMEEAMKVWEAMRNEDLFPDCQTYAEVIRGFLRYGSPADAMNIYEDMKKSPDPPEELPFRILLKGLLPHPLLRNRVKEDFEEIFPDRSIYDPPEEIFGMH